MSSEIEELEALFVRSSQSSYGHMVMSNTITLPYGIYIPLFAMAFQILYKKHRTSRAAFALFILNNILFLSTTLSFSASLAAYLSKEDWARNSSPDLPPRDRVGAGTDAFAYIAKYSDFSQWLNFLLSDGIVVWRAYVLYHDQRLVRFCLVLVLLASGVVSFIAWVMIITWSQEQLGANIAMYSNLNASTFFLSFGSNFVSTVAIACKAWQHRCSLGKHRSTSQSLVTNSVVLPILCFLAETGAFFCVLQLLSASLFLYISRTDYPPLDPGFLAAAVILDFTVIYSGMYPSIVIILIDRKVSVIEETLTISIPSRLDRSSQHSQLGGRSDPEEDRKFELSGIKFANLHPTTSSQSAAVRESWK